MIDDIRYLLVFARIVETGSVSGAAAALQLSAATVSAHLGKLEHSMGTALLYRNTRKLSLTPAGAKLYTSAQAMQQLYADEVLAFKHEHQASVRQLVGGAHIVHLQGRFEIHAHALLADGVLKHALLRQHVQGYPRISRQLQRMGGQV